MLLLSPDNIFMCGERVFSTDSGHPYGYRCSSCRLTIYLCVVDVVFQQTVGYIHNIFMCGGCVFQQTVTSIWVPMLLLSPDNIFMCGERVFQQTVDIHMGTDAPLVA